MIWVEKEINRHQWKKKPTYEWTCIMLSSSVLTLIKSQSNWKICKNAEIYILLLFRKSTVHLVHVKLSNIHDFTLLKKIITE